LWARAWQAPWWAPASSLALAWPAQASLGRASPLRTARLIHVKL